MAYACGRFIGEEITSRCFEELQYGCVFPRGRVRYVNDGGCTLQRFGQSFAGDSVDPGVGGCRYSFMPALAKLVDKP